VNITADTTSQPIISIRPAKPEDASLAAELIYLSMDVEVDEVAEGSGGFHRMVKVLAEDG